MAAEADNRRLVAIVVMIAVPPARTFAFARRPRRIAGRAFRRFLT